MGAGDGPAAVRVMKITLEESGLPRKGRHIQSEEGVDRKLVKTHCVTDLSMSKQQELVEASYQMRCRIFDFSASSFAAIPLELVPLEVDYVEALSNQEVPDYFAGPAMAKTITQETQVVFDPEQEEWKAAILAELQSFATILCDQEKYILHCMHENHFIGESQQVTLKPYHRPPEVDERLLDEILPQEAKRRYVSECQKYIEQLMWLATRTRYFSCPWHLRFHDGEDSSDSCNPFDRIVEICLDKQDVCHVNSFSRNGPKKLRFRKSTRSPTWKRGGVADTSRR